MGSPGASLIAPETTHGYTEQLRSYDVKIVDDPTEMIGQIDGVLIESQDDSIHYERAKPFIEAVMTSSKHDGARTSLEKF
jgi:hypothetical protein